MDDPVDLIGLVAIGAAVAGPLVYGLLTLLGMTHKQFRPILHRTSLGGTTAPVIYGQTEPSIEDHAADMQRGRT